jgi:glycosyltransferase involved in cell wall biosynthesis
MNAKENSYSTGFAPFAPETEGDSYPIIVHSHLGWDWVWQRPQQFLSRLSRNHRVLFIEGPVPSNVSSAHLTLREVSDYPNIIVLQMQLPAARWDDGAWIDQERRRQVQSLLAGPLGRVFASPVQWFYDPMAVTPFAGHLGERAIVYDCMDELSLFRGAPPELVRRERELLAVADVVFAGGPKMWKAKREANANCFCFGCGVDAKHFGQARELDLPVPAEIANLPKPVFGYVGVVDERIDYELLAALADSTSGSVAMIGPSTKVDPATFPQRHNLHWLGGRDYTHLPAYVRGFDVCLMPFALNDATKFINPTKALEYMAAGRPIVSTAIDDVVLQFSEVVKVGRTLKEFVEMCRRATESPDPVAVRHGLKLAGENSCDSIVRQLDGHVLDVVNRKRSVATDAA